VSAPKRELDEFLEKAVSHQGPNCLIWPFHRDGDGYARITPRFGTRFACRYVCIRVNGQAGSLREQAAHTCGKGSLGCVSGAHLIWKTPKENCADRKIHGTEVIPKGPRKTAGLTKGQIAEIRSSNEPKATLVERYKISRHTVYQVQKGKGYYCGLDA
jgi:hypothetical protein